MSIFSKIPWKIIGGFVPAIAEISRQAQAYSGDGKDQEIAELKKRVAALEAEITGIYGSLKYVLAGGIVLFMISAAGLTLGIIAIVK